MYKRQTRINTILQSAFFELTGIIPAEKANELMKAAAKATYGRKGEDVVMKNWAAIDAGAKGVVKVEVPESWKNCEDEGLSLIHICNRCGETGSAACLLWHPL